MRIRWFIILLGIWPWACGGIEKPVASVGPSLIISANGLLTTDNITVAEGEVITIINRDSSPHTVTSQSTLDAFDETGDFDVLVAAYSRAVLELPDNSTAGTSFFFYCRLYLETLIPASGIIVVE